LTPYRRPILDAESFTIYVEKVLVPTLKPGDIVIMDNLGSHKGQAVRPLNSGTALGEVGSNALELGAD